MKTKIKIPIETSARHVHLSKNDLEVLFGSGYELASLKSISQEGEFAASEEVAIATGKDNIERVRIVGPLRKKTQVEISITDAIKLGLTSPIRESGELEETPGITLIGPKGTVDLESGVIVAQRHIHASPTDAVKYNLKDKQIVSVKIEGERGLIFNQVIVRVAQNFVWRFQVDTDEANAAGLRGGEEGEVII